MIDVPLVTDVDSRQVRTGLNQIYQSQGQGQWVPLLQRPALTTAATRYMNTSFSALAHRHVKKSTFLP